MTSAALVEKCDFFPRHHVQLLRLDLLHPITGGNKLFKLRYNLSEAQAAPHRTILTFGGPSSNHLAATAVACRQAGIRAIALVRGEEKDTFTLSLAREMGMELVFVSRTEYRRKEEPGFITGLRQTHGDFLLVPEGGANAAGLKGCAEILAGSGHFDYILCACGTATTYAGLLVSKPAGSVLIGISVLKGESILPSVAENLSHVISKSLHVKGNEALQDEYVLHDCILSGFSDKGYASFDPVLTEFKNGFERSTGVILDHIYTSRLFYAASRLCASGKIPPGSSVLLVHSGGLQGNADFERRYHLKLSL